MADNRLKTCSKCGRIKPIGDFRRHRISKDGHRPDCKACGSDRYRRYWEQNKEAVREGNRERARRQSGNPEYHAAKRVRSRENYRADPEPTRARRRARAKQEPEKERARWIVKDAVRAGRISPAAACDKCGHDFSFFRREAHHEDYSRPLEVRWLCAKCHGEHHQEVAHGRR